MVRPRRAGEDQVANAFQRLSFVALARADGRAAVTLAQAALPIFVQMDWKLGVAQTLAVLRRGGSRAGGPCPGGPVACGGWRAGGACGHGRACSHN